MTTHRRTGSLSHRGTRLAALGPARSRHPGEAGDLRRVTRLLAALALALGLLAGVPVAAVALPPDGAGPDTAGTSSRVWPKQVKAGDRLYFEVSGYPANETVYIKIDDGNMCSDTSHGACVYHTQKLNKKGYAEGSLVVPELAQGKHWLRMLATGDVYDSKTGEKIGYQGYTRRGGNTFTVVSGGSSGKDAGGSGTTAGGGATNADGDDRRRVGGDRPRRGEPEPRGLRHPAARDLGGAGVPRGDRDSGGARGRVAHPSSRSAREPHPAQRRGCERSAGGRHRDPGRRGRGRRRCRGLGAGAPQPPAQAGRSRRGMTLPAEDRFPAEPRGGSRRPFDKLRDSSIAGVATPPRHPGRDPGSPIRPPITRPGAVRAAAVAGALGVLALAVLLSLSLGSKDIPLAQAWALLLAPDGSAEAVVLHELRVPLTLLGIVVGAALGIAGGLMQSVTRNPLADPGILGVNAGASVAVVLVVALTGVSGIGFYLWFAFVGAALASAAVYLLGTSHRHAATPTRLALAGVAISAALQALTQTIIHVATGRRRTVRPPTTSPASRSGCCPPREVR